MFFVKILSMIRNGVLNEVYIPLYIHTYILMIYIAQTVNNYFKVTKAMSLSLKRELATSLIHHLVELYQQTMWITSANFS
jgi:hypothetical protein